MSSAIEEMNHGLEKNFLVFDENEMIVGVLHELFILEAIKKKDSEGPVIEYMSQTFEEVNPEISLRSLVYKMREKGYSILPVFEENQLIGVVDINMVNNFLPIVFCFV